MNIESEAENNFLSMLLSDFKGGKLVRETFLQEV